MVIYVLTQINVTPMFFLYFLLRILFWELYKTYCDYTPILLFKIYGRFTLYIYSY